MGQSVPTCFCYNRHAQALTEITGFTPRVIPSASGVSVRGGALHVKRFSSGQQRSVLTPLLEKASSIGEHASRIVEEGAAQYCDLDGMQLGENFAQSATQLWPPPSVGSLAHGDGICKRCCFFAKDRCTNGRDCEFCHYEHDKRRRIKRKRKNKPTSSMEATDADQVGDLEDPHVMSDDDALGAPDIDTDQPFDTDFQMAVPVTPDSEVGLGQRTFAYVSRAQDDSRRSEFSGPASRGFVSADLQAQTPVFVPAAMGSAAVEMLAQELNVAFWWTDQVHAYADLAPPVVMQSTEEYFELEGWNNMRTTYHGPEFFSPPLSTGMSCFHGACYQSWNDQNQCNNMPYENGRWYCLTPALEPKLQQANQSHAPSLIHFVSNGGSHDASAQQFYGPYPPQEAPKLPPGVEVAFDTEPVPMLPFVQVAFDETPPPMALPAAHDELARKSQTSQNRFVCGRGGA